MNKAPILDLSFSPVHVWNREMIVFGIVLGYQFGANSAFALVARLNLPSLVVVECSARIKANPNVLTNIGSPPCIVLIKSRAGCTLSSRPIL